MNQPTRYQIGLQETTAGGFATLLNWLDVSNLEELRQALFDRGVQRVILEYSNAADESSRVGEFIWVDNLSREHWEWLTERVQYERRYLTRVTRENVMVG
jgi:hypothetical protein